MENKQKICDLLLLTLQATYNLSDLVDLQYLPDAEVVIAKFRSGHTKTANVAADSGTSMVRDIVWQII